MNRQQLLDLENPTVEQAAIQQLLISGSKTSLEADRRTLAKIHTALYKSNMRNLPFENIMSCVAQAANLAGGGSIETTKLPEQNSAPKQPKA